MPPGTSKGSVGHPRPSGSRARRHHRTTHGVLALVVLAACGGETPEPPRVLVLEGITVVDPARDERLPDRTVLIRGSRIEGVVPAGEVEPPEGARRMDGRGRYLIPGLWDAHVHMHHDPASHPLYLADGVTAVRGMGAPPDSVLPLRDSIRSGRCLDPRLLVSGPVLDGPKEEAPWRITVETPRRPGRPWIRWCWTRTPRSRSATPDGSGR